MEGPAGVPAASVWAGVYDRFAEDYADWDTPVADDLVAFAGLGVGMRVLDLGTGTGRAAAAAAARVGPTGSVLAVDVSAAMLDHARRLRPAPTIDWVQGDVDDLDLPDASFDSVLASLVLFHLPDPAAVLARVRRWLRPGGTVAASLPALTNLGGRGPLLAFLLDRLPAGSLGGYGLLADGAPRALFDAAGLDAVDHEDRRYEPERSLTWPAEVPVPALRRIWPDLPAITDDPPTEQRYAFVSGRRP